MTRHIFRNMSLRDYFLFLAFALLLTDISIILDIPFLRTSISFIYFTIFPGLLILHILRLDKILFIKKIILAIGLSISFLMFVGVLINCFYPFISKPLSLPIIIISFNIILLGLMVAAYVRERDFFRASDLFNFDIDLNDKLLSPVLAPLILPVLSILGITLMNSNSNNSLLLFALLYILLYIIIAVYLNKRISEMTYPTALWLISISLLLITSLTSNHIFGIDIHYEYYVFQLTKSSQHLVMLPGWLSIYNSCLSVNLLPSIYSIILNINDEYVFKLLYPFVFSIVPICVYLISRQYLSCRSAFMAGIFVLAQNIFIVMPTNTREEIATLFFALIILLMFDKEVDSFSKTILNLILTISLIISHYSTFYILLYLLAFTLLGLGLLKSFYDLNFKSDIRLYSLLLSFVLMFLWYGYIIGTPWNNLIQYFSVIGNSLMEAHWYEASHTSLRGPGVASLFFLEIDSFASLLRIITLYISFAIIGVGLLTISYCYMKRFKIQMNIEYFIMSFLSLGLIAIVIILPKASLGYGLQRIWLQASILLSVMFILGLKKVQKICNIPLFVLFSLLISMIFICETGIIFLHDPTASAQSVVMVLDKSAVYYENMYVHDGEVSSAKWLGEHRNEKSAISGDSYSVFRLSSFGGITDFSNSAFNDTETKFRKGYIYLGHLNVVDKKVFPSISSKKFSDMSSYNILFLREDKIYDANGSIIYLS